MKLMMYLALLSLQMWFFGCASAGRMYTP